MSSSAGPPPSGGDVNEGSSLMAMYMAESAICLVFVVCRSWIRIKLHNFGIDDFCMIIATVCKIDDVLQYVNLHLARLHRRSDCCVALCCPRILPAHLLLE